ncbi:MAG: HAD family hydrolase, partial [Bacteroidales bacterium]
MNPKSESNKIKLLSNLYSVLTICVMVALASCTSVPESTSQPTDPLPSWNEGNAKRSIIEFVSETTDSLNPAFIGVPDRIAVFDNDGTLWSEKPVYFQLIFAMDRVRQLAPEHPEWKDQQPFRAVLENDLETLAASGEHGILELVMATHTGMTTDEFEKTVKQWITTARHPGLDRPYTDLVFQPMLELLDYLRQNHFKVFIVSGGGIDFMRPWVEEVYGIPREQVVG